MSLRLIFKDKGGNNTFYEFVGSNLEIEIFFKKREHQKRCIEIEDWGFSVHFVLEFQENSIYTLHFFFN